MFAINKTNFNQIPTYQSDTRRASPSLSTIEKQHLHFLDSLYTNEDISHPIHSYDEALALLTPIYDKDYVENKSKINFVSTMNQFNQLEGYKKCHFIDWYSIQDYQYRSYTYLNSMLKLGAAANHHHPLVAQLNLSLMHLSLFDNYHSQFVPRMVYRGEVRKAADMMFLQRNSSQKLDNFFSTSEILDNVISYLKDINSLAINEINVLYEIQYSEPLVGANISALLKDGKHEVLFWPKTEFIITDIKSNPKDKNITIRMKTANLEQHEWDKQLYSLL
ncbi:hypothetical protein [Arsenophonus apicola]|uniref:hypothetical protein n=1 Tax=Arsenophonus apicola TaxID=2879119 RepID=UPI0038798AD1